MGFELDERAVEKFPGHEIDHEDDFADLAYMFGWDLAAQRCRRGLWMRGMPTKLIKLVAPPEQRVAVVKEFRAAHVNWLEFSAVDIGCPVVEKMQQRHQFNLTEVQQFLHAFKDIGWEFDHAAPNELVDLVAERAALP